MILLYTINQSTNHVGDYRTCRDSQDVGSKYTLHAAIFEVLPEAPGTLIILALRSFLEPKSVFLMFQWQMTASPSKRG